MATPPYLDLMLLEIVSASPAHGYGVIAQLRDRSDGELDYPEGTIYPALHRLESAGMVTSEVTRVGGRLRRVYSITAHGRTARTSHAAAWRRHSRAVESVLVRVKPVASQ